MGGNKRKRRASNSIAVSKQQQRTLFKKLGYLFIERILDWFFVFYEDVWAINYCKTFVAIDLEKETETHFDEISRNENKFVICYKSCSNNYISRANRKDFLRWRM